MRIVLVQSAGQVLGSLLGPLIGACISPFSQGGLDQAVGFAIGTRAVGPGAVMPQCQSAAINVPGSVAGAVLSENTREVDP